MPGATVAIGKVEPVSMKKLLFGQPGVFTLR